jgi:hypothetical protein
VHIDLNSSCCSHIPACPSASAPDRAAARIKADHTDQGWSLLCNGVVLFTDEGELLPDGRAIAPVPSTRLRVPVAA